MIKQKDWDADLRKEFQNVVANQKLIIVGTGSLYQKIKRFFSINVEKDVLFFVESNPKEERFEGKEIKDFRGLEKIPTINSDLTVLVCTSAWKTLRKRIDKELLKSVKIYAPYEKYAWVIERQGLPINTIKSSLDRLLNSYEMSLPVIYNDSIMIMVAERNGEAHPYYFITLGVLLKLRGVNVHFLFNDLSDFGEWNKGEGFNKYQNGIIEEMLENVKRIYQIPYEKLSTQEEIELSIEEQTKVDQFIYYNTVWQTRRVLFDREAKEIKLLRYSWLRNTRLIKGYLIKNKVMKIYTWTGVHSEWAMLQILADSLEYKGYSSEYIRSGYTYSITGPAIFQNDVKLLDDVKLRLKQENYLISMADKYVTNTFPKELGSICGNSYVVIPLNIFWDSASFTQKDVFRSFDEWLVQTTKFLIQECNVDVFIRQHPIEAKYGTGNDLKQFLISKFGREERFHFVDSNSNVNTYNLIAFAELVLPNTSTVGIEAAMMGKQVIVKNDVYYADSGFVQKANSIEEYFHLIEDSLLDRRTLTKEQIKKSKLYFAMTMLNGMDSLFGHWSVDVEKWSKMTIKDLLNDSTVQTLLNGIMFDKPLLKEVLQQYEQNGNKSN